MLPLAQRYGSIEVRVLRDLFINRVSVQPNGWHEILYNAENEYWIYAFQEPRHWTEQHREVATQRRDAILRSSAGLNFFEPLRGVRHGRFMISIPQEPHWPIRPYGPNDSGLILEGYGILADPAHLKPYLDGILPLIGIHPADAKVVLAEYRQRIQQSRLYGF